MNVSEAVRQRRSVRAFLDKPVELAEIEQLVLSAARSPSGGNLQPWSVDIVVGKRLNALKSMMKERVAQSPRDDRLDFAIYPEQLGEPYNARRREIGEAMYQTLKIAREDKAGRRAWFNRNFECFGAPALMFLHIDRGMGSAQWADLGMFLQTFMLLCVEAGLATCPQECWALFPETLGRFLGTEANLMLFCGVSIGYEDGDHASAALQSIRAPKAEFVRSHSD